MPRTSLRAFGFLAGMWVCSIHREASMRSDLIFGAMAHVSNRYLLSKLAATAVREMHKAGIRVEETIDHVFMHFTLANPMAKEQKEPRASLPYS
jgi:hypothetical protein